MKKVRRKSLIYFCYILYLHDLEEKYVAETRCAAIFVQILIKKALTHSIIVSYIPFIILYGVTMSPNSNV